MLKLALIFVGAGLGGVLRYVVGGSVQTWHDGTFPVGTFAVNVIGCAAIGFCAAMFAGSVNVREEYRIAIVVGLLGGFTTFSAFAYEGFTLTQEREFVRAGLFLLLSNVVGLLAVWGGMRVAARLYGA